MRVNQTRTFEMWPGNTFWSFQFTRVVADGDFGGGNFTEAYEAAQLITPGDPDSWFYEWSRIGDVCTDRGTRAEKLGNTISARNFLQRASQYYKIAGMVIDPFDERKVEAHAKMRDAFARASTWFRTPIERIHIPYEGHELGGWFLPPAAGWEQPFPTFLWVNGGDEVPEENYFNVGFTMSEAGFGWLCFDQPGSGKSLHELHLPLPYEAERFVTPAVDYLRSRSDVDAERIILAGMSWGGHSAGRAACFEDRVAATILMPATPDLGFMLDGAWGPWKASLAGGGHLRAVIGADSIDEVPDRLRKFDWNEHIPNIKMPLFCLGASNERLIPRPLEQTIRVYEQATSKIKRLHFIERGGQLGGVEHCHGDNRHVLHEAVINWLIEIGIAPAAP